MASTALVLVNGVPRMQTITTSLPLIYEQNIAIVASGGNGTTTLNGPINAGTAITLPSSGVYTLNVNSVPNLTIFVGGQRLDPVTDWNVSGAGPNYTAVTFTFQLVVGDSIEFRIERGS